MDALEIPRAAIFGGSAGAPSAMQFAIRHPDRCAALILLVPMAYKDPDVGHSAPNLSPLAQKILMTIVGSDLAFWLASRLARDMVIEKGPCHAARARQDGEPGRASPCFPRSGDD